MELGLDKYRSQVMTSQKSDEEYGLVETFEHQHFVTRQPIQA
jgi:hypothetical protein